MKKTHILAVGVFAALITAPIAADAHRAWLAPSATVLSGDDPWISVDGAISNTLFHADHNPMRLDNLVITAPDGSAVTPQNLTTGHYRSTFDVQLAQPGTYRIANVTQGVNARFLVNGDQRGWRGSVAELATAIPADATDVRVTQNSNRVETFVTRGAPTAIQLTNVGLELAPVTHPNDLVVGEAASFRLLLDGAPVANIEVTLAPGGARYRNSPDELTVTTDSSGAFSITWPTAGLWWLNASVRELPATIAAAQQRNANYSAVVEVLP
ncbi:MAG: DUF4198 domain-containing protein [Hyphomonadaceae bacterium]